MKRKMFLQWWLIFALIIAGSILAYITGLFVRVNEADFTKLSFLIYGLFLIFSVKCGFNTAKAREDHAGWFVSDILITMGMIGTVIGFIYMLSTAFGSIDASQPQTMRIALTKMSMGMGTALYTTASGLVCSLLLKLQLFNLEQGIENKKIP